MITAMIVDAPPAPMSRRHRSARLGTALCWLVVVPPALWAALRLIGLDRGPLVQALAFTPYVAGFSVLALSLALALRRWWPAALAALAAAALLGVVTPRALASPQPAAGGPTVRLLTANLLAGAGDARTLTELVRRYDVDVLTVQEFTPEAQAALDQLGLDRLLPTGSSTQRSAHPAPGSIRGGRWPTSDSGTTATAGASPRRTARWPFPVRPRSASSRPTRRRRTRWTRSARGVPT